VPGHGRRLEAAPGFPFASAISSSARFRAGACRGAKGGGWRATSCRWDRGGSLDRIRKTQRNFTGERAARPWAIGVLQGWCCRFRAATWRGDLRFGAATFAGAGHPPRFSMMKAGPRIPTNLGDDEGATAVDQRHRAGAKWLRFNADSGFVGLALRGPAGQARPAPQSEQTGSKNNEPPHRSVCWGNWLHPHSIMRLLMLKKAPPFPG